MLDADLARLDGVETRVLVQAVKRKLSRFPEDFKLQLSAEEFAALRSQSVISNAEACGGWRTVPCQAAGRARRADRSARHEPRHLQPQHPSSAQAGLRRTARADGATRSAQAHNHDPGNARCSSDLRGGARPRQGLQRLHRDFGDFLSGVVQDLVEQLAGQRAHAEEHDDVFVLASAFAVRFLAGG